MDIYKQFFLDKKKSTRRVYQTKLRMFFEFAEVTWQEFLECDRAQAVSIVMTYKNYLANKGSLPATVNNHLAAIKSFVIYANSAGKCNFLVSNVQELKA